MKDAQKKHSGIVFAIFRQNPVRLKYFLDKGLNIRSRPVLEKEYRRLLSLYNGWMEGIAELGYQVRLIDNPNFLVPRLIRYISPRLYVFLLRGFEHIPLTKRLEHFVYNLFLLIKLIWKRPEHVFYIDKWIAPYVIAICKRIGCTTIEYRGTTPQVGGWEETLSRNPDVIVSGYDATSFPQIDIQGCFYQIEIGPNPKAYGKPDFDEKARLLDVNAIGRYDDGVFLTRSQILNEFLASDFASHLSILIAGYVSFEQKTDFSVLIEVIQAPRHGRDYVDALKTSKFAIVVPSDDHLQAGNGMPQRVFQNAAAGCMQLVYSCDAVKGYFKDEKEIVLFDDVDDLIAKIQYYLDHDRERVRIARNAYRRFLEEYTAQIQIKKLFATIKEREHN
ncbi:MAG: glycosyltransferase [Chloroflexota bacterium]|nr:glycosyltransferase [Chloroflexota bacterium]